MRGRGREGEGVREGGGEGDDGDPNTHVSSCIIMLCFRVCTCMYFFPGA